MDPDHFDHLLALLDLEHDEERARLDGLLRTLSPEERAERGITLLDVSCVDEGYGLGGRLLLDLERDDRSPLAARDDQENHVEIRPRRANDNEPARAVVARRTRTRVTGVS